MPDDPLITQNFNTGHRERLRQRFRDHGLENFQDYEALELLLLYVARQKDMKPIAKRLIEHFGSFQAALDASQEDLLEVEGVGEVAITLLHFVKQAAARYLAQNSRLRVTPEVISALIDYCGSRARPGRLRVALACWSRSSWCTVRQGSSSRCPSRALGYLPQN